MIFSSSPTKQILNDIAWPDSTFRRAPPGIADEDWDLLFVAVQIRLKSCAAIAPNRSLEGSVDLPLVANQTIVMECVHALEALHVALKKNRVEYW